MKTYFNNCKDLNEAKDLFRKLCMQLHPDHNNGKDQEFIKMHAEFKTAANTLKFKTGFDTDKNFNPDNFYNNVQKFDGLKDVQINFIGDFIWLTDGAKYGAMYSQLEQIKKIYVEGLNVPRWASKKKSWMFSPIDYSQKSKSKKTLDELKQKYNSKTFTSKGAAQLSA
jgi:hypothetical protein